LYYIVFFTDDYIIKAAHKSLKYPSVGDIVYLLKNLEQLDLEKIEDLKMDILSQEEFNKI